MHESYGKKGLLAVLMATAIAMATSAQGPAVTLPGGTVYTAGPDYATDILQDPWDFSNPEDISPDPDDMGGWAAPTTQLARTIGTGPAFIANGRLVGTTTGSESPVMLLYRGDAFALNPGRSGLRFPIETARYRKLAIKIGVSGAGAPQPIRVFWFHTPDNNNPGATQAPELIPVNASERIYTVDLSASTTGGYVPYLNGPLVRGLRLNAGAYPQNVQIDWVRLTASDNQPGSAMMPVSLGGCVQFQSLIVTDAAGVPHAVTDSTGTNQNRSFNYGVFPPGSYHVAAVCSNGTTSGAGFHINARPSVTVLDPDETGDPSTDYAAAVRADPWDFSQATDVARAFNVATTGGVCPQSPVGCGIVPSDRPGGGLMLRATTVGQYGDPGLELLNGVTVPLNSRRHRLLTFSLRIHRPYVLNAQVGPVARVLWSSGASGDGLSMTQTQDMRVWPGFQTYTVDLGALTTSNGGIETECASCPTTPWVARALRFLRLDPHEIGDGPSGFDIDDVKLTARDQVAYGQTFTVRFAFSDADPSGGGYTARIYLQPWPGRTEGGPTGLATLSNIAPGQHAYTFNPLAQGIPAGEYTISVDVDELGGGRIGTSRAFSTGALVVANPAASTPKISVLSPAPGQSVPAGFSIEGCAYDDGVATGAINVDDIAVRMRAVAGPRTGLVLPLGFEPNVPHTGRLQFGPLGSPVACPTGTGPYAQAGFRVVGVGAGTPPNYLNGTWMIDVFARSTISGGMIQLPEIPIQIGPVLPQGPVGFQASASGNTVTVSFQPVPGGAALYQIQGSLNPSFSALAFSVNVPAAGTYSGQLGSGTYFLRVFARLPNGQWSAPSETRRVDVALPTPPGAPTLVATQVAANPVTLSWSPGPGGSPSSYTIYAGTAPGASDLVVAPLGAATSISAVAPVGRPIYVRVVAANAAGSATSNEIAFALSPPSPPTLNPPTLAGRNVTLSWSPGAGGAPSGYTVRARYPGSAAIIAALPVARTTVTVPAPPGSYVVTVVSHNAQGTSAESNPITVTVPQ